jgi:hypothetical protein
MGICFELVDLKVDINDEMRYLIDDDLLRD